MTPPTDTQLDEHTVSVSWLWPMWRRFVIRTLSLAASMAVFLSLSSITAQAEGTDPRIVKIKAAFAYTLAKFVEWPDNAFKDKRHLLSSVLARMTCSLRHSNRFREKR